MSAIVVATPRAWLGNQRLGSFAISLDGSTVGTLPPGGTLRLPCLPGRHGVRARQWWYLSPTFELIVEPGRSAHLEVDLIRNGSLARRMFILMLTPWRSVVITAADDPDGRPLTET